MSARHAIAPLVVAVALTACTGAPEAAEPPEPTGSPSPTVTESESPSGTPTPSASASASEDDPYAAPAPEDVDVEYVQRVLEGMYPIEDQVIFQQVGRDLNGMEGTTDFMYSLLETIFGGEALEFQGQAIENDWEDGTTPLDLYKRTPGAAEVEAEEVIDSTGGCFIATYFYDSSPRVEEPRPEPGATLIAQFEPKPEGVDPEGLNPTPWIITRQGLLESVTGDPKCP